MSIDIDVCFACDMKVDDAFAEISGAWMSGNVFSNVKAFRVDDIYVFAVHDGGYTKMVGVRKTGDNSWNRVDGRYVNGHQTLDHNTISKCWKSPAQSNVGQGYYTIGSVRF